MVVCGGRCSRGGKCADTDVIDSEREMTASCWVYSRLEPDNESVRSLSLGQFVVVVVVVNMLYFSPIYSSHSPTSL